MSLTLTLLGTGTPTPLVYRAGSSYLVTLDDEVLLFDCGPACVQRLLKKGVPPKQITRLFLTHLHYDHCADYGYLVVNRWDQDAGQSPELDVYGPDLAARTGRPGSQFIYEMRGGKLPRERPEPDVTEVAHGDIVEKGSWRLKVAEVAHAQPYLICFAYRLDTPGRSIVFGGDTAPTETLTELAKGADILLHMCHYVNGAVEDPRIRADCSGHLDAARTARDAGVNTLILVHITEQLERPGIRERVLYEAGEIFEGHIIFGEDLLDIPLEGIEPEKIQ